MATVRTKTYLDTLLATNGVQGISATDLRDFKDSVMGVYASIYTSGGSTSQTMGTSAAKLTLWASNGEADNASADATNNEIEVGAAGDGDYLVIGQFSFSGAVSTTFTIKAAVNGVEDDAVACERKLGTGGDVGSCSFAGIITLADGDLVSVYVTADAASKSFTLQEGSLTIRRIG